MDNSVVDETSVINESDCCGNGCANCILNVGLRKSAAVDRLGKRNIISTYQKFQLLGKNPHNPNSRSNHHINEDLLDVLELHFGYAESPQNASDYILDIPTGHHVMMRVLPNTPEVCLRPYSPYWVDALTMEFKILLNLKWNGVMSRYIRDLKLGDVVEFRGPIGAYAKSESGEEERIVYIITQGVAIAPTLRIVNEILENEEDMSRVYQLACYSDLSNAFFRDTLREYSKYWNYKVRIYLAHQRCSEQMCSNTGSCSGKCASFVKNLCYKELAFTRRLDKTELVDVCSGVVCTPGAKLVFVVAGSRKFQDDIAEIVKKSEINVMDENIVLL